MNTQATLFSTASSTAHNRSGFRHSVRAGLLFMSVLTIAACGSNPVDEARYTQVEAKISEAEELKAENHAGSDIYSAQKKLEQARKADSDGDRSRALALLQEAELHAELAEIRSLSTIQQASLDEINRGLDALEREMAR